MSSPNSIPLPDTGEGHLIIDLSSVDFPAPFGPTNHTSSPLLADMLISDKMRRPPRSTDHCFNSIAERVEPPDLPGWDLLGWLCLCDSSYPWAISSLSDAGFLREQV